MFQIFCRTKNITEKNENRINFLNKKLDKIFISGIRGGSIV